MSQDTEIICNLWHEHTHADIGIHANIHGSSQNVGNLQGFGHRGLFVCIGIMLPVDFGERPRDLGLRQASSKVSSHKH